MPFQYYSVANHKTFPPVNSHNSIFPLSFLFQVWIENSTRHWDISRNTVDSSSRVLSEMFVRVDMSDQPCSLSIESREAVLTIRQAPST